MVCGELSDQTLSDLAGKILGLRGSNAPITVFINSPGGDPRAVLHLLDLLKTKAPLGRKPRIITVAVGNVASAAANLLSLGDYAIAYPRVTVHFHGLRYRLAEEITMEFAAGMANKLIARNRETAEMLAKAGTVRLGFHFARLKSNFQEVRERFKKPNMPDVECLAQCLRALLSEDGIKIIDKVLKRWQYIQACRNDILPKALASGKTGIEFGGYLLNRIVASLVKQGKKEGAGEFTEEKALQMVSTWAYLRQYDLGGHTKLTRMMIRRFGEIFFSKDERAQIDANPKSDAAAALVQRVSESSIKPFCYFAHCIWDALQEEENPLSATDAYALGAVDEVYDSGLPCIRETMESREPDQPSLPLGPSKPPQPPTGEPSV